MPELISCSELFRWSDLYNHTVNRNEIHFRFAECLEIIRSKRVEKNKTESTVLSEHTVDT